MPVSNASHVSIMSNVSNVSNGLVWIGRRMDQESWITLDHQVGLCAQLRPIHTRCLAKVPVYLLRLQILHWLQNMLLRLSRQKKSGCQLALSCSCCGKTQLSPVSTPYFLVAFMKKDGKELTGWHRSTERNSNRIRAWRENSAAIN